MQTIEQSTSRSHSPSSPEDQVATSAAASAAAGLAWVAATPALAVLVLAGAGMNWLNVRGLHGWAIGAAVGGFVVAFGIFAVLYSRFVSR